MSQYQFSQQNYPSVTQILSYLDKPGLSQWSVGCMHRKGQELAREGNIDISKLLTVAKTEPDRQKKFSMELGNWVHQKIYTEFSTTDGVRTGLQDWIDQLILPTVPVHCEHPEGFRWSSRVVDNIYQWSKNNVVRWIEMERPIVHEGLGYAGTPDFVVEDKSGRTMLVDVKVSKRVYDANKMQICAYSAARSTMSGLYTGYNGKSKRFFEGEYAAMYIHRTGILLVDRDTGKVSFHEVNTHRNRYFEAFRGLLHCYYHMKKSSANKKSFANDIVA